MVQVDLITGFLGAGKTTFLRRYAAWWAGQGVKVCVEIAVMALDAGLIPHGEEIIVVAGSGRGADTAVIMHPAHANNILETKINEILCKPRNF